MRRFRLPILAATMATLALSCSSGGRAPMESVGRGWKETGVASWYGSDFHGLRTANGEIYDMYGMTAAHKRLPFDTLVEVTNLDNGRTTRVRINDRGPFVRGRIIDLTQTAADAIAMIGPGTARVRIRVIGEAEVPGRRFVIQVGAFSNRSTARSLREDLERHYPDVRIESGDGLYRVVVGRFKKQSQAKQVAERLRRDGYSTVVRTRTSS